MQSLETVSFHPKDGGESVFLSRLLSFLRCAAGFVLLCLAGPSSAIAGDLLRGGATFGNTNPTGSAPAAAAAQAQARAVANDVLAKTTMALQSVQAAQVAAQKLAAQAGANNLGANPNGGGVLPNVPNGLTPGGLQISGAPVGASAPTQSGGAGGVTVTVNQTAPQAILNWSSFNVGKNTTLVFNQSAGGANVTQWIAFNKVNDPSGVPSQILGSIQAPGQVYIINQNGIIFGATSQVNVHTLVASALPINNSLINSGLLNNPNAQFLFSAENSDASFNITASATTHLSAQPLASYSTPVITYVSNNLTKTLTSGTDYVLTKQADGQELVTFTASGIAKAGTTTTSAAIPVTMSYTVPNGNVTVQSGALLTAPASAASVGGRVALVGASVVNAGTISTPAGQTILAAGLQVGFAAHNSADPSLRGLDAFVGAVVDPGSNRASANSGTATNTGFINVPEGNAFMTGMNVNQNGVINSTTSVALNGRIDLIASYNAVSNLSYAQLGSNINPNSSPSTEPFLYQSSGVVTLGKGSLTQIVPELTSMDSIVPTITNGVAGLAIPSQVNLQGLVIHVEPNAVLYAPNGNVTAQAGQWSITLNSSSAATVTLLNSAGQIYLDSGAIIDVSGSEDVSAPITQNIIQAQLRGAELADSPLQRNGPLRGSTVTIDIRDMGVYNGVAWVGSPIGNLFGYASTIQETVGELTINGGTVNLSAGNSVVIQNGAMINVSGGWINYQGGMVQTTRVVTADGHILDISQATPDMPYAGIYTGQFTQSHPAWGVTNTYTVPFMLNSHFEQGYTYGGNGGNVNITAPSVALDGTLLGVTVTGPRQNTAAPVPSSFSLTLRSQIFSGPQAGAFESPTPPTVTFGDGSLAAAAPFALDASGNPMPLRSDRLAQVILSPNLLTADGFGSISLDNSDGNVVIPAGVTLNAPAGGSVSLKGSNITVNGTISAPAGSISLTTTTISPYAAAAFAGVTSEPSADPARGLVTLASGASLNAAGLVINNMRNSPNALALPQGVNTQGTVSVTSASTTSATVTVASVPTTLTVGSMLLGQSVSSISGTTITLGGNASTAITGATSQTYFSKITTINGGSVAINAYSANLAAGSVIDVSGGVLLGPTGTRTYGNGGIIMIATGLDPNQIPNIAVLGGTLNLGATLLGYSGAKGGSLSIQAQQIEIGSGSYLASLDAEAGVNGTSSVAPTAPPLVLSPEFFSEGGFSSFTLTSIGAGLPSSSLTNSEIGSLPPAVEIDPGTVIAPVATNIIASINVPGQHGVVFKQVVEPVGMRTPVSLHFAATGATDQLLSPAVPLAIGNVVLDQGASIRTDPAATVSFSGQTVAILGSVTVPGGSITVKGAGSFPTNGTTASVALPTVYLGPQSVLSAAGTPVFTPNAFGQQTGFVLPGGSISVSGNIVAMAGSVLDVSGSTAMLDLPPSYLGLNALLSGPQTSPAVPVNSGLNAPLYSREVVRTRVDSNGGTITLTGSQELFTDATLLGKAGGPSAAGGTLFISSNRFYLPNVVALPSDVTLTVTQNQPTIPVPFFTGQTGLGSPVVDVHGNVIPGMGYFAADSFLNGGFDALSLGGTTGAVDFVGPVSITARSALQVAQGGFIYANSRVTLTAPYVDLGTPFLNPVPSTQTVSAAFSVKGSGSYFIPPTFGPGSLTVHAQYIDVGNLSLQNIGRATLVASGGDIRGDGTLDIQGDLVLRAAQIYPATEVNFTIVAYDHTVNGVSVPGSVTIGQAGTAQLPLSAGGTLSIYASDIIQRGTLVAPFGSINLGYDGTGTAPVDNIAGVFTFGSLSVGVNSTTPFPITQRLTLGAGSVTSVSGVNVLTGEGIIIPYGTNLNGEQWIDPAGTDITATGVPLKSINLQGQNVSTSRSSVVSIEGGGDLLSYRFVPGLGGSTDILASSSSFAVVPGYQSLISPFAAYDDGFTNSNLKVGEQIYLAGSSGLSAGVYTLLPARYALLPGGVLVTPVSGAPIGTLELPGGSAYVDGQILNGLAPVTNNLVQRFQVSPQSVINQRAEYDTFLANTFFPTEQQNLNVPVTRLPADAGHLVIEGIQGLSLLGQVQAGAPDGGLAGLVDISTPQNIYISGSGTGGPVGSVVLSSAILDSYGAESLLIGGVRTLGSGVATVNVTAGSITVNNAGTPLSGPEIILASNKGLTLDQGAVVSQSGSMGESADTLFLKDSTQLSALGSTLSFVRGGTPITFPSGTGNDLITSTVAGTINKQDGTTASLAVNTPTKLDPGWTVTLSSGGALSFVASGTGGVIPISLGDGTLLRVSGDPNASIVRTNVASSTQPTMVIGKGAVVSGGSGSVTLDSTYATSLNPGATLSGNTINLDSGQITFLLPNNPGTPLPTVGLVLTGSALQSLQSAEALSFLSYSSIDVYGTGQVGSNSFASLSLHAGEIRGFNTGGGTATFAAQSITLDNKAGNPGAGPVTGLAGSLEFNANTIQLGVNQLNVDQYQNVVMNAPGGVLAQGTGSFNAQGNLAIDTSFLTTGAGASQSITAQGTLALQPSAGTASVTGGLGASLVLQGGSVIADSNIIMPSGLLTLHATGGDLTIGGKLDVSGTSQVFEDLVQYTGGGEISLISDTGAVTLSPGAVLNVSANSGGGDAGTIAVQAPSAAGTFNVGGSLLGKAGPNGQTGNFVLDVGMLTNLGAASSALEAGQFTESRSIRVRSGSLVVSSPVEVHSYSLFADNGDITVNSTINASGVTGGTILLSASGSITLAPTAVLTVAAQTFNSAGKGGSVTLEAGSEINGVINTNATLDIEAGSVIDLSVGSYTNSATVPAGFQTAPLGDFTGTLHLRAPQNSAATDLAIAPINGTILNPSSITVEGYQLIDLSSSGGSIDNSTQTAVSSNGTAFASNAATIIARLTQNNPSLASAVVPSDPVTGGSFALGATQITLASTAGFLAGDTITGTGIGVGTTIVSVSGNTVTLSKATTTSGLNASTGVQGTITATKTTTAVLMAGSNQITVTSAAGLAPGDTIVSAGNLPTGTTITSISGNTVTLSNAATASQPGGISINATSPGTVGTFGAGSTKIAVASATGFAVNEAITGSGIAPGTIITAIAGKTLTLSQATVSGAQPATGSLVAAGATANILQVVPGYEIINNNPATVPLELNTSGSAVTFNSPATFSFSQGTPGSDLVKFSAAGTMTSAAGVTTSFSAGSVTALAPGSVVSLSGAGTVTFVSGSGGPISLSVSAAGSMTTPTSNATSLAFTPTGSVSEVQTNGSTVALAPGSPVSVPTSNLTLNGDWDLSTFRFATSPGSTVPGVLTLRATGDLVFDSTLSDGFSSSAYTATVLTQKFNLPSNAQSWSYNLAAGADLSTANLQGVQSLTSAGPAGGSLLLGVNASAGDFTNPIVGTPGGPQTTNNVITGFYQVIRTGTGDINIAASNDVLLLNPFATIYSAGVQVADPTLGGTFSTPVLNTLTTTNTGGTSAVLGGIQESIGAKNASYPAEYLIGGGNVSLFAQGNIAHETQDLSGNLVADSEAQLPTNWLYRRGFVDPNTGLFGIAQGKDVASTSWWIDFSNFFEGIGAFGGGNITLNADGTVSNVDAVIPTTARMPGMTTGGLPIAPNAAGLVETGGGDLVVKAGGNIDAGVYYVERGNGTLSAGGSIVTNNTRSPSLSAGLAHFTGAGNTVTDSNTWLPTTLFLGQGGFNVSARGSVLLGPVANPFLLPEGYSNTFFYKTYFSTYGASDSVNVSSLGGTVTLRTEATIGSTGNTGIPSTATTPTPLLEAWFNNVLLFNLSTNAGNDSNYEPWLRLDETQVTGFSTVSSLMPPALRVTAFSGDINIVGNLTLSPSPVGTISLAASGSINALQPNGLTQGQTGGSAVAWSAAVINLSDANPANIPGIASPLAYQSLTGVTSANINVSTLNNGSFLTSIEQLFSETGSSTGAAGVIQTKEELHDPSLLHLGDPNPAQLFAVSGNISGLTLFAGKETQISAGQDITDISLYIQNVNSTDVSFVSAGRNIVAYDPNSPLRQLASSSGNILEELDYGNNLLLPGQTKQGVVVPNSTQSLMGGDIQISGPGTLEVLAGANLNLGNASPLATITGEPGLGITSIGNARNPALPFGGADLVVAAGIGPSAGLGNSQLDFSSFLSQYLSAASPATATASTVATSASGGTYLAELAATLTNSNGGSVTLTPQSVMAMSTEQQDALALQLYMIVLRDAGRSGDFATGNAATSTLFPKPNTVGDITVTGREIKTVNGGNLTMVDPVGQITVGLPGNTAPAADQGIFTVDGGNVGIFANGSTNVGISRIFTLHGGNIIIWSSTGNIDAGASAKTVTAAPPTRVLIDPQSGDVQTDLGGLATGGGIGVLATVAGVPPGSVDLIAQVGTVDAGDAGIRATGSVNIAAAVVLNASNISAPSVTGAPTATVTAAPNVSLSLGASATSGSGANALSDLAKQNASQTQPVPEEPPSIINVEVLGYGGGENDN